jgi:glutamate-1-semialdehyde 2,1-aminomutase
LSILEKPGVYRQLDALGKRLGDGLVLAAKNAGIDTILNRKGSMMTLFFGKGPVRNFTDAAACDATKYARFHNAMLERGFYFAPSAFEAAFVSLAHTDADIDRTLENAQAAFQTMK